MPRKRERSGSGITEREVTVIETPLDADDVAFIRDLLRTNFEDMAGSRIDAWAQRTLARERIQLGCEGDDDNPPSPPTRDGREVGIGEGVEADSPAAYAMTFLYRLAGLREAIDGGDADRAARIAFSLGQDAREAELKYQWEKSALRGKAVAEGGVKGNRIAYPDAQERREQYRQEYDRLIAAGKRPMAAADEAAIRYGVNRKTILRARDEKKR